MPPRRGMRRKTPNARTNNSEGSQEEAGMDTNQPEVSTDAEMQEPAIKPEMEDDCMNGDQTDGDVSKEAIKEDPTGALPFKVKLSNLPAFYTKVELQNYMKNLFKITVAKVISPSENNPWVLLCFSKKEEQDQTIKCLNNHMWKKSFLAAVAFLPIDAQKRKREESDEGDKQVDEKKTKKEEEVTLTLEQEVLQESLPLFNVPYEEQNKMTIQDVEVLSARLHALMCARNPALAGWAEAGCNANGGTIFKVEPLKASPVVNGYRNKCKFRIGKNADGETTVGFCLNDNSAKILAVRPGDKLIHLPDSMKFAAKKFEEHIRATGLEPHDKKAKKGYWDNVVIRVTPSGELMMVAVVYHNNETEEKLIEMKTALKEFFISGAGRECRLFGLFFQILNDKPPMMPSDKLELLCGEPAFEEVICGLRFHVGPFTILNVNSPSTENIYTAIMELLDPQPDSVGLDLCAGTGGIAFTLSSKCAQVVAVDSQEDNVKDALKTKALNGITNVEVVKNRAEFELSRLLEQFKDKTILPVLDPPRQGLPQRAIVLLRSKENIQKMVYVCCNTKVGVKNFLDLCAASQKSGGQKVALEGLPFLPVKAVPVDVAPYTVNTTVVILLERVDPSTFPPATKPPPEVLKKDQPSRERGNKTYYSRGRGGTVRGFRGGSSGAGRGVARGGGGRATPVIRQPPPLLRGRPFPVRRPLGRPSPWMMGHPQETLGLVEKYERRIQELEQQDRAFKAGLQAGLQALGGTAGNAFGGALSRFVTAGGATYGQGVGASSGYAVTNDLFARDRGTRNSGMGDYSSGDAWGGYRGGYKDPYSNQGASNSPWKTNLTENVVQRRSAGGGGSGNGGGVWNTGGGVWASGRGSGRGNGGSGGRGTGGASGRGSAGVGGRGGRGGARGGSARGGAGGAGFRNYQGNRNQRR